MGTSMYSLKYSSTMIVSSEGGDKCYKSLYQPKELCDLTLSVCERGRYNLVHISVNLTCPSQQLSDRLGVAITGPNHGNNWYLDSKEETGCCLCSAMYHFSCV